jgi:membrane protein implicated in regulation of membrane protease activity
VEGGVGLTLFLLVLPAIPAFIQGSIFGGIFAAVVGLVGIFLFVAAPAIGIVVYLLSWIISWMFGNSAAKRRRSERQHRELVRAIRESKKG